MAQPKQRWLTVRDWRLPIAATVALAYAAIAGGELAYTLFYILAGVVTLSYFWVSRIHRDLHCLYDLDKNRMSRDDVVTLTLRLDNEGILAVPWAVATDQSTFRDPDADWTFAATIPMASSRLLKQELPIKRRGRYRLGPVSITAGDPFGIFAIHKVTAGHKVITVYPRATPVRAVGTPLRQPFGNSPTDLKSFADPSNLAEIRPYAVGDNPKHIHWPTSARLQQLHVREFELMKMAQALAGFHRRDHVLPDDVQEMLPLVFRHRVVLTPEATWEKEPVEDIIAALVRRVRAPVASVSR